MYVTFANENSNQIQVAYSVKDSLVFDYQIVNTQHWSGNNIILFFYKNNLIFLVIDRCKFLNSKS